MMKASELVSTAVRIANRCSTLYVMGGWGQPLTAANKNRLITGHSYNQQPSRRQMINNASASTYGFDCVCMIKSILWGFSFDTSKTNGGAVYASNGVPDINADQMIARCPNATTNFSNIEAGEVVWKQGHIGIYIGDGLAVECTPAWKNCVQITAVLNIGSKAGYNGRTWTKHGKLPWIDYTAEPKLKGWKKIDGEWYYYSDGKPLRGWQRLKGSRGESWFWFNDRGQMTTGLLWLEWKGKFGYYYFDPVTGAMQTGGFLMNFNKSGRLTEVKRI